MENGNLYVFFSGSPAEEGQRLVFISKMKKLVEGWVAMVFQQVHDGTVIVHGCGSPNGKPWINGPGYFVANSLSDAQEMAKKYLGAEAKIWC